MSNQIKTAVKTRIVDDDATIQKMQIQLFDAVKTISKFGMYGLYSNAPKGSFVIVVQSNGQEEVLFGAEDDVNNRPRGLKEGEVMVFNTLTQNYLYMDAEGNTKVYVKKDFNLTADGEVNITATKATFNCDVKINGTLEATIVKSGNGSSGTYTNSVTATNGIVTAGS